MTKDLNSNISLVEYNSLNLPSVITFSNNMDNITNIYTSTGTKLRSISSKYAYLWEDPLVDLYAPFGEQVLEPMLSVDEHPDFVAVDNDAAVAYVQEEDEALAEAADDSNDEAVISEEVVNAPSRCKRFWGNIGLEESKTTDYCANVIYQDGKRMLLVDGGYVTFNDSLSYGEGLGGARYHYYLKDHLGNVRVVFNDQDSIEQVTNYYPFGSPYCDTQSTINPELQPFKYNGKELDMMHGLNAYDYGARQYYSPLPVWDRVDPLAEKYYNVSPYAYCNNNPVNAVDPDGRDIHPVTFRKKDNRGNACGEAYLSYVKYINAMTAFSETIYGRELIGSFIQKGQSQYGVEGSGKNADCILSIHQFGFDSPTDNYMYMGKNNASFSLCEKEGKLNFVLQLDCSFQNQEEITESLLHEFTLHGYLINDIIEAYRNGGIEAAQKIYNSMSESSDHDDLKTQPHVKGGGLYNKTAKELTQKNGNLQDIIERRRKVYE